MTRVRLGESALMLLLLAGCPDRAAAPVPVEAAAPAEAPHAAAIVQKRSRAFTVPLQGAEWVHANDHIDVSLTTADPDTHETMAMNVLQNSVVLDIGAPLEEVGDRPTLRPVTLLALPEEAEVLLTALHTGTAAAVLRNPEDVDLVEERGRATLTTLLTGERINRLLQKRLALDTPAGSNR